MNFSLGSGKIHTNTHKETNDFDCFYKHGEKMAEKELVILTAFGKDMPGLVAGISNVLAQNNVNIEDISQTIMQDQFAMIMLLEISKAKCDFEALQKKLNEEGEKIGLQIKIQHKNIFEYMHRV